MTEMNYMVVGSSTFEIADAKSREQKVALPLASNGSVNHGIAGQFAVSDGAGGITWLTVQNGNEVAY